MLLFSSSRLNFYKLSEEHFEDFCAMDLDPEVMTFYTTRPHGTREYALQSFNRYKTYMEKCTALGGFAVFSKETNEFVGLGVLAHLELNPDSDGHEVGYRLPKKYWGQGYATEIGKALINYGFNTLGFSEIFGTTHPDHIVSQTVLMKCGLQRIGTSAHYGGSALFKIKQL
jgi:ribosomal-protein-alanine N-acetyltransferase